MVRYRKLGRVELNVTHLEKSRRFYEEVVGLQYVDTGVDGEIRLRCDHDHHNVVLYAASAAGLRCAGFMLEDEAQFKPLIERLTRAGLEVHETALESCRERAQLRAVRVFEPLNHTLLLKHGKRPIGGQRFAEQNESPVETLKALFPADVFAHAANNGSS